MGKANAQSKARYLPPIFGFDRLFPELARAEREKSNRSKNEADPGNTAPASEDGAMERAGFPDGARILISGEAGCGKTTFALAIIRALMLQWNDEKYRNQLKDDRFFKDHSFLNNRFILKENPGDSRQLYYLSTEVTWAKLDRLFGQYGWFSRDGENRDKVFDRGHVRLPRIPEANMSLPVQGAHPLVDLVLAQLKSDLEKSPLMPSFVLVDSLTAILKDSRDAGERRREAIDFMDRIEQAMGDKYHALTFVIAERAPEPDQVAYAEEIAAEFVFRLGYRPTSSGRFLRTFRITKAAGVEMHLGEHSWGIIAGQTGLDAVIASKLLAWKVRLLSNVPNAKPDEGPWGTICVFPRPIFPSIGTLNEDSKGSDPEQSGKRNPDNISSGTPGLDQLLNQKVAGNYWVESALDQGGACAKR